MASAFDDPATIVGPNRAFRVEYHESLESTNALARERAAVGERDLVVLAEEQTGGTGRRGRSWLSPPGGIWASVLLQPSLPPSKLSLLPLAGAVAVVDGVRPLGVDARIKWPNDVLVETAGGEAKLAGVLAASASEDGAVQWAAVGIGLNANVDPAELVPGATSLQALVGSVDRGPLLETSVRRLDDLVDRPDAIVQEWRSRTSTIGRRVAVDTDDERLVGMAIGLTEAGALLLATATGERVVTAGDCEHLRSS